MSTPASLIDIALRHSVYLERLKSGVFKQYDPFLQSIAKQIKLKLVNEDLTDYTRLRLEKLIKSVNKDIRLIQGEYVDIFINSSLDLVEYEAEFEVKSLNQIVKHDYVTPSATQLKSAVLTNPMSASGFEGKLLEPFVKEITTKAINNVSDNIRSGAFRGLTTPQIIKNIIGTKSKKYTDGELRNLYRSTEKMVRTGVAHVAAQARQETWKNNSDIITGFKIVTVFDSRTSPICRKYGSTPNKIYEVGVDPVNPFHIGCRSTTSPSLDPKFSILDKGATRAARDKDGKHISVDANQSYYGWLKTQPAPYQDSVIGKTRGQLLRNGGLTEKRFGELQMNKKFKPLTLSEMRKLEPNAFSKIEKNTQ